MDGFTELEELLGNAGTPRETALQEICKIAVRIIPRANLVSLWRFDESGASITSLVNFDVTTQSFTSGTVLCREDFPVYFKAIVEQELIVASDARNHSCTRGFNRVYFTPLDIYSLLDFILHKDFKPYGVICLESKGQAVNWTLEDQENIRILATLISFCFEG